MESRVWRENEEVSHISEKKAIFSFLILVLLIKAPFFVHCIVYPYEYSDQ